ncbi:MAG: septum formation initiator family protein [Clostridia bacterium]|nr:septum formation initiator family protein [Clostridia bacterium]
MATPTMERQNRAGYRSVAGNRSGYQGQTTARATVSVPDYTRSYPAYPPFSRPLPTAKPRTVTPEKQETKTQNVARKKRLLRTFSFIAGVFVMCFMMIYRYAMILETNDRITKLNQQIAELESANQFLEAKLDRALELGTLETYATEELGMIRPDTSQMFYVDVTMEDTTVTENGEEENRVLQGTPGALVHAIRVLK